MRIIYKIGIRVYFLLVLLASPFNEKARRWLRGRRGMWRKIKKNIDPSKDIYWFHCSSLGEFEQGRPLIERIREEKPDVFILLTFFSPSGYELRKNYSLADLVTYLPLDTRFNAWRFMNLVKPAAAYFIKYEFWYYFLRTLRKKKVPVFLVSAKFRSDQAFFKWWGKWYRKFLNFFAHIFVQDEQSLLLLKSLGHTNVTISGDTRFDRVFEISTKSRDYPGVELFKNNKKILIAGSTWEKDEELLVRFINENNHDYKFILAPHEINSRKIYKLISEIDSAVVKFTEEDKSAYPRAKVMIIDTIGHLSSVYKYGDIAYIGGGFGKGIHNILEAATYSLPVVFGPNYQKFTEAVELISKAAAYSISDFDELNENLNLLFGNDNKREECSQKAGDYVKSKLGATDLIIRESFKMIPTK
ncbi:MAG: 3-deoxy-D-manno-octulosonic acid transferase [Bacteroidales bacterium]